MSKVLVLTEYYLPGFNGGGVLRTLVNLVSTLGQEFSFSILCRNHDLGEKTAYQNIHVDEWNQHGNSKVFYVSSKKTLKQVLKSTSEGIWYINSVFSFFFSILPLLLQKYIFRYPVKIIIAPKGELFPAARNIKSLKKKFFIKIAKTINLYRNVLWHASTEEEAKVIREIMGQSVKIKIALDLPANYAIQDLPLVNTEKNLNELNIVSVSRIAPIKNILMALKIISELKGKITFNLYGPIDDQVYWEACQMQIKKLPNHVKVAYHGVIPNDQVCAVISKYDVFLLPTLGESFGHVIFEALLAGCPVLISDQTPWKNLLEKEVGADFPLTEPMKFQAYLSNLVNTSSEALKRIREKARAYALEFMCNETVVNQNRALFQRN
ncbi:MAG: glycosyltransferase family 4 protein [Gammaproteobacteria bacterium]